MTDAQTVQVTLTVEQVRGLLEIINAAAFQGASVEAIVALKATLAAALTVPADAEP